MVILCSGLYTHDENLSCLGFHGDNQIGEIVNKIKDSILEEKSSTKLKIMDPCDNSLLLYISIIKKGKLVLITFTDLDDETFEQIQHKMLKSIKSFQPPKSNSYNMYSTLISNEIKEGLKNAPHLINIANYNHKKESLLEDNRLNTEDIAETRCQFWLLNICIIITTILVVWCILSLSFCGSFISPICSNN